MAGVTAVRKGYDFAFNDGRYQLKANQPSGKPGSFVTWVPKAKNYDWEYLVWILYDPQYVVQEAWLWERAAYRAAFDSIQRLAPAHYRRGDRLV